VALKVLREDFRDDIDMVRRFVEEAQIGGQLQHPGIVPIYEMGLFGDRRPFFAMKLVKGDTLAKLLDGRKNPAEALPRFLGIFEAIAQTVAYSHARGVVHRDLKPSNVMVGNFGEVQVMDWGLAKVLPRGGVSDDATAGKVVRQETVIATARSGSDDSGLSRAGSAMGTPSYMAPEQARGEIDRIDERADVFALGSILCEILTGQPAFIGRNSGEIQRKAALGDLADAMSRLDASGADRDLIAIARDCLAREPEDRPRDAGEVVEALSSYLAGVQQRLRASELDRAAEYARAEEALKTAEASEARARAERSARRLTAALAVSVVGLIALGAGGYSWMRSQEAALAARTAASVDAAPAEAERAAVTARSASTNPESGWAEAVVLAQKADELARQGAADEVTRLRAATALERLSGERSQAAARARQGDIERRLVSQLVQARVSRFGGSHLSGFEFVYRNAFLEAGLDPDGDPDEAGAALRSRPVEVAQAAAAALDNWALALRNRQSNDPAAARLSHAARIADPDPWRCQLRTVMEIPARDVRRDRVKRLAEDARVEALGPVSLDFLGLALVDAGDRPAAIKVLLAAQRRYPGDASINYDLGYVLEMSDQFEKAIPYLTAARAFYPESGHVLAHCLADAGEFDEAEAVYRDLVRLRPELTHHGGCFGRLLRSVGRSREGAAVLDATVARAIETLKQGSVSEEVLNEILYSLCLDGRAKETEAASREAIRRLPSVAVYHYYLATSLAQQRRYPEAEAAARDANRLQPERQGLYYTNLGTALRFQGRLEEALAAYRTAEKNFRPGTSRAAEVASLTRRAERQVALAPRLPAILRGDDRPKNAAEGIDLAEVCLDRDRPAAASRLFAEALAAEPSRAEARIGPSYWYFSRADARNVDTPRYEAARAAILAGTGRGLDAPPPNETARAVFRRQALALLRQERAAWTRELERADRASVKRVRRAFESWIEDLDLNVIRLPEALDALPDAEGADWQALWDEVDATLQKAAKIRR
jgi:serine/threonine-protein kinase